MKKKNVSDILTVCRGLSKDKVATVRDARLEVAGPGELVSRLANFVECIMAGALLLPYHDYLQYLLSLFGLPHAAAAASGNNDNAVFWVVASVVKGDR